MIVFCLPPLAMQPTIFVALERFLRWRGHCATYPQLPRSVLAPRGRRPMDRV